MFKGQIINAKNSEWQRALAHWLLILVMCVCGLASLHAETLQGKVIHVADGDTITILDSTQQQFKIRLAGIDAPEKAQAFGQRAKGHLAALVHQKQVTVETSKKDKYGRHVGQVILNGQDVNLEQLRVGLAWYYRQYERELTPELRESYAAAQAQAKAGRIGLWRDEQPVPPWQWRHPDRLDK